MRWFSGVLAEKEGFEPPVPLGTLVFKTSAFDHSANLPIYLRSGRDSNSRPPA